MAATEPAGPAVAEEETKRTEGDEWCDSGLGSLGGGGEGPWSPGSPPREGPGKGPGGPVHHPPPSAWLSHVLGFVTEDGDTALHLAVIHEHEPFLDSILRHVGGSQYLDLQNDLGQTALHLAAILGLSRYAGKLRGAGAGLCVQERGGHTPLHLACREGHPGCARELLGPPTPPPNLGTPPREEESRAQLEMVNYDGHTPLHVAVLRRDPELVTLLIRAGADLNRPEPSCGRSPLHLAVEAQSPEVLEVLLRGGADPTPRMFVGFTPLDSARRRPDPRLAPLLRAFGGQESPGGGQDSDDEESEEEPPEEEEYDDIIINSGRCPD